MKKLCLIFACCIIAALPVCAMKYANNSIMSKPTKVKVFKVDDALQVKIIFEVPQVQSIFSSRSNNSLVTVYVSNLDCHEYSQTELHKSTLSQAAKSSDYNGVSYLLPAKFAKETNSNASNYVKSLFRQYKKEIYFIAKGYGERNNLVGEFYVNGVSLNKHLIEKGYCSYVN